MSTFKEFRSDRPAKMLVEIDSGGEIYLVSECCGCSDAMTDVSTITALRDALGEWLSDQ